MLMEMNGTIEKYLNKELCVKPFYGYGWSSYPQRRTYEDNVSQSDGQRMVMFEEPYTVVPYVRICGGTGGAIRVPTRPP